jgi:hypothetical protein
MEYSWTTAIFIGVTGSGLAILITLIVVAGLLVMPFLPTSKTEAQRRNEEELYEREDGNPTKSSQNDANRLLQQIEANTRKTESNTAKTAFWTKVVGVPVLIGLIIGALAGLTKC